MKLKRFGRYALCALLVAVFLLLYVGRLFQWQILMGDEFRQESMYDRTDVIELDAARGQILDRNGNVLVGNRTSYNIVYNALDMVYEERNATILKVLDLLEERGEKWRDRLPIVLDENGEYQFAENREDDVASLKENLNMADYATAEQCVAELADTYGCRGFSKKDTRSVTSVRYSMTRDGFSRTNPYVIAENVSAETVGIVKQRSNELRGIEPRISVIRYYGENGLLAPHVIGHTGIIQEEQYKQAVENGTAYDSTENLSGYKWTDTVGRSGIEAAFESELRGQRGEETIFTDDNGELKSTAVTTQPKEGNTVQLTLDSDLQRVANFSLEKNIKGNTLARDCTAGAVVALDAKTFGVLACSSYPTFDMAKYVSDDKYVQQLNQDENEPQLNRALDGAYVPGSVFKPMVALSALQEGTITAQTTWDCYGTFEYYDLKLGCLNETWGAKNVYNAIAESCNVFFCNVGLGLGIDTMDVYAKYFGLGEKTGVELGEATGIMSGRQEHEANYGVSWVDGLTAHAAIGQADNMFTPIQLATYCATIANGGKRLETHFLDKILNYTGDEVLSTYQPKELYDADFSADVLGVVRDGMIGTATYGTASDVFGDYPITIACKTGTGETSDDPEKNGTSQANISFICYAPANDPEIVVGVMLEYGYKGSYAKNVAKDILDQYFGFYTWDEKGNRYDSDGNMVDDEGKVIKTKQELDAEKAREEQAKQEGFLNSAPEDDPSSEAAPSPSPTPLGRDDIPNVPYTGTDSAETSQPEDGTPTPTPAPTKKPDSPYYSPERERSPSPSPQSDPQSSG